MAVIFKVALMQEEMKKRLPYLLPIIFLIGIVLLTWILFFSLELVSDNEKRITCVFAILALGFGVFQFWVNELNIERRKKFDLRYETYKEIVLLIESISETINIKMISKETIEAHGVLSKLINQINNLSSTMNRNNDFLFPDICKTPESKKNQKILENIILRTDKFRIGIENAAKHDKYNMKEFAESIEEMNWHNEIREYLKELHDNKYDLYKKLRTYF